MILANAIHFQAQWMHPPPERATRAERFHLLDGRTADVPMMRSTESRPYARGRGFQALEVPYGNDWVVMLLVLPESGELQAVERTLDVGSVSDLTRNAKWVDVALTLPRFRVESSFALREPLIRMGIERAFTPGADFTRISEEPGCALGEVLHKAVVDVDEKGTEAAAATAAVMVTGASFAPRPPPIEFRVDRPFLFLIEDKPTGTILFLGRVVNPRA
jgi:serpin B